ncbi:hypothetical protein CASP1_00013 [Alcaligenes phage CASP1]|nr:hypothetical protein CASP1_00013 [Alcaligenes phage CASP1]
MLNVNIKDSDWPEWAEWVAQDRDGCIYFFEKYPSICSISNTWTNPEASKCMMFCSGDLNDEWKTAIMKRTEATSTGKHSHYFKDVSNLNKIDVYRVLDLYEVTDPCIQHAVKKLLVAGKRGAKDQAKDIQEAIDTLTRWKDMQGENNG